MKSYISFTIHIVDQSFKYKAFSFGAMPLFYKAHTREVITEKMEDYSKIKSEEAWLSRYRVMVVLTLIYRTWWEGWR